MWRCSPTGGFLEGRTGLSSGMSRRRRRKADRLRLVRNGDRITMDAEKNLLTVDVPDQGWPTGEQLEMPPYKATRGTLAKYIRLVKNASLGCVTDED